MVQIFVFFMGMPNNANLKTVQVIADALCYYFKILQQTSNGPLSSASSTARRTI